MCLITVNVEAVIAFEQHMMTADHMTGVESGFHPMVLAIDVPIIRVVIGDNGPCPGGSKYHDLVGEQGNAVFYKSLGGAPGDTDIVAAAAVDRPRGVVDVQSLQLDAERIVDGDTISEPERILD